MPRPAVKAAAFAALLGALALTACEDAQTASPQPFSPDKTTTTASIPQGSGFDFYVLSLSWSPSYCLAEGEEANRQQCNRREPLGFVVHGLWPQNERGYPEFCRSNEPDRVPDPIVDRYRDLLPSAGLIGHQWRKHGSCSGLSQRDYFSVLRQARERVTIPDSLDGDDRPVSPVAIEEALAAANPGLDVEDMGVSCQSGLIREVRICLTRDTLDFRPCPEIDRQGCKRPAQMPER